MTLERGGRAPAVRATATECLQIHRFRQGERCVRPERRRIELADLLSDFAKSAEGHRMPAAAHCVDLGFATLRAPPIRDRVRAGIAADVD